MDMLNVSNKKIKIINLFNDSYDFSGNHIVGISFEVNGKTFYYDDYIDPVTRKIIKKTIKPSNGVKGNNKSKILSELSLKFHITDDDSQGLLLEIIDLVDEVIESTPSFRKKFPSIIDLSKEVIDWGFSLVSMEPFHAIKIEVNGLEQHICSKSIQWIMSEIDLYASEGEVSESYSFWELQDMCRFNYYFYIERHPHVQGWNIFWRGKESGKYDGRHVKTLRELSREVIRQKALSPDN